eukprot:CAMPEP_0197484424 /NCGR_PEP_ID=MMETSP1309-20131121/57396_1 /TAXON_ID=464262 /ORGANISM="Genus nov. species nov., Strain RCC998" /LENGTH=295 /DNA_ID=CAMNT_0043027063 /DNA_START=152 /DNA_END=1039 /DNA_ORIENTATION=-
MATISTARTKSRQRGGVSVTRRCSSSPSSSSQTQSGEDSPPQLLFEKEEEEDVLDVTDDVLARQYIGLEEEEQVLAETEGEGESGKTPKVAHLNAKSEYEVQVNGQDGSCSIGNYLKLPIEQYFISDPDRITKISQNEFVFQLPKLKFFNVWVAPGVTMSVEVDEGLQTVVNIKADKCVVTGSKFVEKMKINDRLKLKVRTSLREVLQSEEASGGSSSNLGMKAQTSLQVWCEIVPPFNLLPTAFLEKSCNAVLRTTLNSLLKAFMIELKDDYHLWSTDSSYREERARRSLSDSS